MVIIVLKTTKQVLKTTKQNNGAQVGIIGYNGLVIWDFKDQVYSN